MSKAERIGRRAIKVANSVVNLCVLVTILLLLSFGVYALWDSHQIFGGADAANYTIFRPSAEDESYSFQQLQAINDDVFAWLTVYGTGIDYPVVQGPNNLYYVSRCAQGTHSFAGSIFLDSYSCRDFTHFSSIFYGHHMARGVMFGDIGQFVRRDFFEARRYGMLYFGGREHGLEFFAFVHTHASDTSVFRTAIEGGEQQQAYLDMLLDRAIHTRDDVPVTIDDRLVLLSTCSEASTQGRDILIGRITDELFEDTFETDNPERTNPTRVIDRLAALPMWASVGMIVLPCLLILLLVVLLYKKRAKKEKEKRK